MLAQLSIRDFLDKTAGNEPVPGGGSVSALCAALSTALGEMVARLTIGKKRYIEQEEKMKEAIATFNSLREGFIEDIDADSEAYNGVFSAFKLPKETEEEQLLRAEKIEEATRTASEVPLSVARKACGIMDLIADVARNGNRNAVTDACVAMMCARTAVLGAVLNVRINLSSLNDTGYAERLTAECNRLEKEAGEKEREVLEWVGTVL